MLNEISQTRKTNNTCPLFWKSQSEYAIVIIRIWKVWEEVGVKEVWKTEIKTQIEISSDVLQHNSALL
jgi:hypothetical protein